MESLPKNNLGGDENSHRIAEEASQTGGQKHNGLRITCIGGAGLLAMFVALFCLSHYFSFDGTTEQPILAITGLLFFAAVFASAGFWTAIKSPPQDRKTLLLLIVCFGLSARLFALITDPILELDYYRYLWDGKVQSVGVSPYQYSPEQILNASQLAEGDLKRVRDLAHQSEANHTILSQVHFPEYTSLYPPVSQFMFALTMRLVPHTMSVEFHVMVIKFMLLLFDIATMWLIYQMLNQLKLHLGWLIVYAWNPLVIKEIANTGHLDSIATFFMMLAFFLIMKWHGQFDSADAAVEKGSVAAGLGWRPGWRVMGSAIALGLGVGAKLFPIVFLPAFLVTIAKRSWKSSAVFLFWFVLASGLVLMPLLLRSPREVGPLASGDVAQKDQAEDSSENSDEDSDSKSKDGLVGFFSKWRMNDAVFSPIYLNFKNSTAAADRTAWYVVTKMQWRENLTSWFKGKGIGGDDPAFLLARVLTLGLFSLFYLWHLLAHYRVDSSRQSAGLDFLRRLPLVLAIFLFLQPTVNPWYFVWAVPLTCFSKNRGWLLVSGLLMIYYSRFWFKGLGNDSVVLLGGVYYRDIGIYDHLVAFVEFGLILLVLFYFGVIGRGEGRAGDLTDSSQG